VRIFPPRQALRAVAWPLVVYTITFAVVAKLFPFAKGTQVDFLGIHRFSWFAVHPIDAATFAALGILFVAGELLFAEAPLRVRLFRVPLWMYLAPLGAVLIVTHSRGPLLACVGAVAIVAMRRAVGALAGSLIVASLLMIGVVTLNGGQTVGTVLAKVQASHNPAARLLFRGQTAEEFESFTDRDQVWSLAEQLIANRPVAGYGYQGSRSYLLAVVPWAAYAHNALLQTLLDLGIIGALLLWLPFVRTAFVGSLSDTRLDADTVATRGVALSIALFLLLGSFSSESFAAAPGYQTVLLFTCIFAAEQVRGRAGAVRAARDRATWRPAIAGLTA
jgi:O-antigen ligase